MSQVWVVISDHTRQFELLEPMAEIGRLKQAFKDGMFLMDSQFVACLVYEIDFSEIYPVDRNKNIFLVTQKVKHAVYNSIHTESLSAQHAQTELKWGILRFFDEVEGQIVLDQEAQIHEANHDDLVGSFMF